MVVDPGVVGLEDAAGFALVVQHHLSTAHRWSTAPMAVLPGLDDAMASPAIRRLALGTVRLIEWSRA